MAIPLILILAFLEPYPVVLESSFIFLDSATHLME